MPSGLIVCPISTSSSGLIVCPHLSTSYLLASLYGLPSRQTICLGDFASSSAIWPSDYESDYGPTVLPQHFAHIDPSSTKGFLSTSSSFTLVSTSSTSLPLPPPQRQRLASSRGLPSRQTSFAWVTSRHPAMSGCLTTSRMPQKCANVYSSSANFAHVRQFYSF
ncbi:hypothetical protein EDB19DRAFT_1917608 [Suillus lakei]|nr:hypothetical protein EDB19DRAFT_1917608 [Suillus lakei]